ncbi:MFS transporter [Gordonia sp. HY285]|uniref:MFS transporter n=1 Tax=Gordonia liuliyuniae TaxID=2911517 RepID=A0ABS9ITL8_9ACTN|nr:MFS transporter [Gordonia liuliyuniae]MCF8588905.1 MFS transporter [Gordonia liuliyuniae]MCF8609215.1 MFS transporter [Gordonia liuliyuniae]
MNTSRESVNTSRSLVPSLIYAALTTSIVSSLGMLLVPSIASELDVSVSAAQWMLTVNLLVGAVATPIMGRLSDGLNTKRLLLISLGVILVGSAVAAAAPTFGIFLIGRALQGLTYGIVPITIVLARRHLGAGRADPAISTLSVTVATGLGLGYPLTGVLASLLDYRVAFWFAAVFVLTAIIVVWKWVPADGEAGTARPFDTAGAALLSIGLAGLLIAVSQGSHWGWLSVPTIIVALVGATCLVAWATVELRTHDPLINLYVVRSPDVLLANLTAIGLGVAMYMSLSTISIIAQAPKASGYGLELPLFWAGFVMLPLSIGSLAGNRFVRRLGPGSMTTMLPAGSSLMAASALMIWLTNDELWEILVGMTLFGLGMGSAYAAMPTLIARNVAVFEVGSAVSFNQVLRTVGGAVGSAIVGSILAASPGEHGITVALGVAAVTATVVCVALVVNQIRVGRK